MTSGRRRFPFPVVRMMLLAAVAVGASAYGVLRYYTRRPPPTPDVAPRPTEIPAPDLVPVTR